MNEDEMARLCHIGFGPVLAQRALAGQAALPVTAQPMRVLEVHRETLRLHRGDAEIRARTLPRVMRALEEHGLALAAGDWVLTAVDEHGAWWVHARLEPMSHLARRDGDGRVHALVSNVDTALLLMGLDDDFNLRRLERFLALVQGGGVQPVIVLTKADLAAADPARMSARLDALRARVPGRTEVFVVNAKAGEAAVALTPYLNAGQTLVLLGSSGAGKSTLTNTLLGGSVQDTGAVRASDHRGQHTTTSRCMFLLPGGACVIDTPGVRTLSPADGDASLAASFSDIETLRMNCRFRDCTHAQEPGCAVREGLDADRLRNYHKLLREVRRDTVSALQRREQVGEWKARGKAAHARLKAKRGEA